MAHEEEVPVGKPRSTCGVGIIRGIGGTSAATPVDRLVWESAWHSSWWWSWWEDGNEGGGGGGGGTREWEERWGGEALPPPLSPRALQQDTEGDTCDGELNEFAGLAVVPDDRLPP